MRGVSFWLGAATALGVTVQTASAQEWRVPDDADSVTLAQEAVPPDQLAENPAEAPPRRTSPVVQSLINRAVDMLRERRFADAVDEFDNALAIDPGNVWAHANRGLALAQLERNAEAEAAFDAADALATDNPVALRGRGLLALRQNRTEDGIALMTRSLEVDPGNDFALYYRGAAYRMLDRPLAALADAEAALAVSPAYYDAHMLRFGALLRLERKEEAATAVADLLAAMPGNSFVQSVASQMYAELGEDDRAEALLADSLAEGETPMALLTSAQRRPVSETATKLRELNRALELDPNFVPALMLRANTLWAESRLREALADVERVLAIAPRLAPAYELGARVLMEQNRPAQANDMIGRMVDTLPDDPQALMIAVQYYRENNQAARAEALIERMAALSTAPAAQAAALLQRLAARPADDVAGRESDADAVLAIDPGNAQALYAKAWARRRSGDQDGAVAAMRQLVAADQTDPQAPNGLALELVRAGQQAEAEALFDRARAEADGSANDLNSICWNKALANIALDRALEECRASLALHEVAATRDSLAMVLLRMGELDAAMREFDTVLAEGQYPTSYFGRALILAQKGNSASALRDAAEARRLWPEVDAAFAEWGFEIPPALRP